MSAFNSILKIFLPKDRIFYQLFESREQILHQIEDLEHKNDDLTHKIFTELSRNFITPFDREDIHYLASAMDDVADYIFASAKKINFYRVDPSHESFSKMADLIIQACENIKTAVYELKDMKNMRKITDALVRVNSIENQADDIFDMAIADLFENEKNAVEIIKNKE